MTTHDGGRPAQALDLLAPEHLRHCSGEPSRWRLEAGVLEIRPGTGDVYADPGGSSASERGPLSLPAFQLHVEFWLPHMPDARGQDRANSGVYVDGRFELQLLDSLGSPPAADGCGAIYKHRAPDYDAALPPEHWQTLDVAFCREGEGAQLTVIWNGVLVHNQVHVPAPTPGALESGRPVLLLQDHGAPVRFRNLWVLPSRTD